MLIYSIKDLKAGTFATPWFQPTQVHAIRAFKTEVNRPDPGNMLFLYPSEYQLVQVGHFNEETGAITPVNTPVATGDQVKNPTKESSTNGR